MRFRQLRTPTFRARLRLFFVVIVVVPMITMAVVLFVLIVESERSQTDARLSEAQTVSMGLFKEEQRGRRRWRGDIGTDQRLADALDAGDKSAVQRRLDRLARDADARYVEVQLGAEGTFEAGALPAVAPAVRRLQDNQQQADRADHGGDALVPAVRGAHLRASRPLRSSIVAGDQPLATTQPDAVRGELPDRGRGRRSPASTIARLVQGARRRRTDRGRPADARPRHRVARRRARRWRP